MKIGPLMESYKAHPDIQPMLVHTGQHYDEKMSDLFFRQFEIPKPDVHLDIGGDSHAAQTPEIGFNGIVGTNPKKIIAALNEAMFG